MTGPITTPYSTVAPFLGQSPSWLPAEEVQRIGSYQVYEDMYWTNPDTFAVTQRGSEANPIYVPSARIIVETINRYVGKDMSMVWDPAYGEEAAQVEATKYFKELFDRERFYSTFASSRRFGLIRGDWCFHVTADAGKPQGKRLSIESLDPGMYFPVFDPNNVDKIIGIDIVEQVVVGDKSYIKKLEYRRTDGGEAITSEIKTLQMENWNDPEKARVFRQDAPLVTLPAEITAFPVYHIRNFEEPNNPFGSSEIRGLERIAAAINQAVTDEEIALAMEGLGTYATDSGAPVDSEGNPINWVLGPGRVVELSAGSQFNRVSGVGSLAPYQDHLKYLMDRAEEATGVNAMAKGEVDVSVAESGIALRLRLSPILARSDEKDIGIKSVLNQMFYDLRAWAQIYDQVNTKDLYAEAQFGDKIPLDRSSRFTEIMNMFNSGLVTAEWTHGALNEIGNTIPPDMVNSVILERAALDATSDPYEDRLGQEAESTLGTPEDAGDPGQIAIEEA